MALLTDDDLSALGRNFSRCFPVEELSGYDALLAAIDKADEASQVGAIESFISTKLKS